jgi:N6-adenosine-specific RNA methylase IME4
LKEKTFSVRTYIRGPEPVATPSAATQQRALPRKKYGFDTVAHLERFVGRRRYATILADPPWRFLNRTGKVAPEHRRLSRYSTMPLAEIMALPVGKIAAPTAHLYLWCPNALLPDALAVMKAWGFTYKSNIVWHKIRKDGGSDGRGVGFYFRNVTELLLFGVRGKKARTLQPGRRQVNYVATRKREHSRKPDEIYDVIEACSKPSRIELFARGCRAGWDAWGDETTRRYSPKSFAVKRDNASDRSRGYKATPKSKSPRTSFYIIARRSSPTASKRKSSL